MYFYLNCLFFVKILKKKKVPPKNFTELDRLAYVVRVIENDCAVTPVGAFRLTPTH